MKCSICMSTYDKASLLKQMLESVFAQHPPFEFEVIVVDDGSPTADTRNVCAEFPVQYHRIDRSPGFKNPCVARNVAYRAAKGEVVVCQSDEVLHVTPDCIERLVVDLTQGTFLIARVLCRNQQGAVCGEFTGMNRQKPYFFLGSLLRKDLYAIGGNDEDFIVAPAYDDAWFADCLMNGLHLKPVYSTEIIGHHLWHSVRNDLTLQWKSERLYQQKVKMATEKKIGWCASGGPWPCDGNMKELFTDYFKTNAFGGQESVSGPGSSMDATAVIRKEIPALVKKYGVRTMLDIPCGDFRWMQHVDLGVDQYIGGDIVQELVEDNHNRYACPVWGFQHLDLLSSDLPKVDLVLCRDIFVHFRFLDIKQALVNIKRSGSKYLLATTFTKHNSQVEISKIGEWHPYNLQLPPLSFPEPIEVINENCREGFPSYTDKSLGLWKIEGLP